MESKNCLSCGKKIDNKRRKYCSYKCSVNDRIGKERPNKIRITRNCIHCGQEFTTDASHKNKKYCSHKCYSKLAKIKKVARRKKLFDRFEATIKNIREEDFNLYYVANLLGSYRIQLYRIIKEFSGKKWIDYLVDFYSENIRKQLAQFKTAESLFIELDKAMSSVGVREKTFANFSGDRNKRYQFDCLYIDENTFVEYNGYQHYVIDGVFNKNQSELEKRFENDNRKEIYCLDNGYKLIEWPFNLSINKNNIDLILGAISTNQQPRPEELQYKKLSGKVQRLIGEAEALSLTRAPEARFINFGL